MRRTAVLTWGGATTHANYNIIGTFDTTTPVHQRVFYLGIEGGFTITQRGIPNAFEVLPVMVYRVFPDGREELVRGVDLIGTPLTVFSRVTAGDDQVVQFLVVEHHAAADQIVHHHVTIGGVLEADHVRFAGGGRNAGDPLNEVRRGLDFGFFRCPLLAEELCGGPGVILLAISNEYGTV